MEFTRYELLVLAIGIPFLLWSFADLALVSPKFKTAAALVWFGVGATLMLLSRIRSKQQS